MNINRKILLCQEKTIVGIGKKKKKNLKLVLFLRHLKDEIVSFPRIYSSFVAILIISINPTKTLCCFL